MHARCPLESLVLRPHGLKPCPRLGHPLPSAPILLARWHHSLLACRGSRCRCRWHQTAAHQSCSRLRHHRRCCSHRHVAGARGHCPVPLRAPPRPPRPLALACCPALWRTCPSEPLSVLATHLTVLVPQPPWTLGGTPSAPADNKRARVHALCAQVHHGPASEVIRSSDPGTGLPPGPTRTARSRSHKAHRRNTRASTRIHTRTYITHACAMASVHTASTCLTWMPC